MNKPFSVFAIMMLVGMTGAPAAARAPICSVDDLLAPAPIQPIGYYDQFGKLLKPRQAFSRVVRAGLDPRQPESYQRLGMVHITKELVRRGETIFFQEGIGDHLGVQQVLGTGRGLAIIAPDVFKAIADLKGQPTTNLHVTLSSDLTLGSTTFPKGTVVPTGLDVEAGATLPIGLRADGNITCALCHATIDLKTRKRLDGVPNGDLFSTLFIALAPNSASGFARVAFDPLAPEFRGNGKTIINSLGQLVTLPDPVKLERAIDDFALSVPAGQFESSPDRTNNTSQIPSLFTFRSGPYGFDGQAGVGPFAGLSAFTNSVHSSEINLLAAAQNSAEVIGIDPEVYLGIVLQNAADPAVRLPEGAPVQPSLWLRSIRPDVYRAELENQVAAPGTGLYPALRPSLFTFNGLIFSPDSDRPDLASGKFLEGVNAMAAYQNSLLPPPNKSAANKVALASGAVRRGAQVFKDAGCAGCHAPPFFTDNRIHPNSEMGANPARASTRLPLESLLVAPKMYTLNTPVPIPADAEVLNLPTAGFSPTPTSLPFGLSPGGGYRTTSLRGLAFSASYLHDGGVAVRRDALAYNVDGSFSVVEPRGLGMAATLNLGILPDAAGSLRALVDRRLRAQVVAANHASPALVFANLEGIGHHLWVDAEAGFTPRQQADLVDFLLALDDDPGRF